MKITKTEKINEVESSISFEFIEGDIGTYGMMVILDFLTNNRDLIEMKKNGYIETIIKDNKEDR